MGAMTDPSALAALHATCLPPAARWSAEAFAAALTDPACFLVATGPEGFALGRVVAGEAELLTLAVACDRRRAGLGRSLLDGFEGTARARGAADAFLEVAADNAPARALYLGAGWEEVGRRRGYYAWVDAVVMRKRLDAVPPAT